MSHRSSHKLSSTKTPISRSSRAGTANNTPLPPNRNIHNGHTSRSNTITNIKAMMKKHGSMTNINKHRQSRSEVPKSIKKNDLFNIYKGNNSDLTKAYFSNLTKAAKSNQSEVEKKARQEVEKKYKPQLQKSLVIIYFTQNRNENNCIFFFFVYFCSKIGIGRCKKKIIKTRGRDK